MKAFLIAAAVFSHFENVPVKKTVDGDTIRVTLPGLPAVFSDMRIRLKGIDTAELSDARECGKRDAQRARELLGSAVTPVVSLAFCEVDLYFRLDCFVKNSRGEDLSELMIKSRLARLYAGGKRPHWVCVQTE